MSYSVNFVVKVADTEDLYVPVGNCSANITYNIRDMIVKSTGLTDWCGEGIIGKCVDIIPAIERGYGELNDFPEEYKKYESPNGWGTVSGCSRFFADILEAWYYFKEDYFTTKLIEYAYFYIG